MLTWLLLTACVPTEPSSDLLGPAYTPAPVAAAAPTTSTDPRFTEAMELEAEREDPWIAPVAAEPVPEAEAVAEDTTQAAAVPSEAPAAAPAPGSGPVAGLPTQAEWGVRLLTTLPQAQPPRAAIGLPDGSEVVVSPGSMLPSVGLVVLSVGPDRAQLARVKANGDHAVVDTVTLTAQYPAASP